MSDSNLPPNFFDSADDAPLDFGPGDLGDDECPDDGEPDFTEPEPDGFENF